MREPQPCSALVRQDKLPAAPPILAETVKLPSSRCHTYSPLGGLPLRCSAKLGHVQDSGWALAALLRDSLACLIHSVLCF